MSRDTNVTVRRCKSQSGSTERTARPRMPRSQSSDVLDEETAYRVTTVLRVRPPNGDETERLCVEARSTEAVVIEGRFRHRFKFTHVCSAGATQQEVYKKLAAPLVSSVFTGFNVCIFAYGQTGSGKTFSLCGTAEAPGMTPRFCADIFATVDANTNPKVKFAVHVAFYEIHIEKIYDLLASERKPLRLRGVREVFVDGATNLLVSSIEELEKALRLASSRRSTAANGYHGASSRSHFITHVIVNQKAKLKEEDSWEDYLKSNIYLVDLAGSERLGKHEITGNLKNESIAINCSLSVLHRLMFYAAGEGGFVSYRESTLTHLLRDCFVGNARLALLATVCPTGTDCAQTRATCEFASAVAGIPLQPIPNTNPMIAQVQALTAEVACLKAHLAEAKRMVAFETPVAPAIVELNEDPSLCTWKAIEKCVLYFGSESDPNCQSNAVGFLLCDDGGVCVHVYEDDVGLNGLPLAKGGAYPVSHGDRLVIRSIRCLLVFLDNSKLDVLMTHNYRSTKLEFLEVNFSRLRESMESKVRAEAMAEKQAAVAEMEDELGARREELERLNATGDSKQWRKERRSISAEIDDRSALLKRFQEQPVDGVQLTVDNSADRLRMLSLEATVGVVNKYIERFQKQDLYSVSVEPGKDGSVQIRMKEMKLGVSSVVRPEDLEELRDVLREQVRTCVVPGRGDSVVGELLFSFCRRCCTLSRGGGRAAEVVQTALLNSMNEAASERRTNVRDLRRSVCSRRTSAFSKRIAAAMGAIDEGDENGREAHVGDIVTALLAVAEEEESTGDETSYLSSIVTELWKMRSGLPTLRSIQRGAIRGEAMEKILIRAQCCVIHMSGVLMLCPQKSDPEVLRCHSEVKTTWANFRRLYVAWLPLSAKVEQDGVGETTVEVMAKALDEMVKAVGKFAFWMGVALPRERIDAELESKFMEGVEAAMREIDDEVTAMTVDYGYLMPAVCDALKYVVSALRACIAGRSSLDSHSYAAMRLLVLSARRMAENGRSLMCWKSVGHGVQKQLQQALRLWQRNANNGSAEASSVGGLIEEALACVTTRMI